MNCQPPCQDFRLFLENLSRSSVGMLGKLLSPEVRFRDPMHDVKGIDEVKRVYLRLFDMVDSPRFRVTHSACAEDLCFLRWHFTCRPRLFGRGHPWIVEAVTALRFDPAGRVVEQADYWDAGQYLYERLHMIGPLVRFFRKRRTRPTSISLRVSED